MKSTILGLLVILALLLVLLPGQALAKSGGRLPQDVNISTAGMGSKNEGADVVCGNNCHGITPGPDATVSVYVYPETIVVDQTGVEIEVVTDGMPDDDTDPGYIGILIVNNDALELNIKGDGWIITADPVGSAVGACPCNFNPFLDGMNRSENWTVTAPSTAATYYIKVQARQGITGNLHRGTWSTAVSVSVGSGLPEFPLGAIPMFSISGLSYLFMRKRRHFK